MVQIEPPVGEVSHGSLSTSPREIGKVDVGDRQRLDVLTRLGGDAVACKGKVARRQNARLRILNIHVVDAGQIADVARQHHEALVLDRASLRAVADAHVSLSVVGTKRDKDDASSLVYQSPCQFRELAVITNQHADRTNVGLYDVD